MKPAKKKSDRSKLYVQAEKAMIQFSAESKARFESVQRLISYQDMDTRDAIERMTNLLVRLARRRMWFGVGNRDDRIVLDIPEQTVEWNMTYMAVEILKDLGQMDVQIEAFDFNPGLCCECQVPVKPSKSKKKVVKKRG